MLSIQADKLKEVAASPDRILVGIDIGGTNVRVALQQSTLVLEVAKFNAHSANSLWESLSLVFAELSTHIPKVLHR